MTTTTKIKSVDLDRLRVKYEQWMQARRDMKTLQAFIDSLEQEFKDAVGDAEEARINGVLILTHKPIDNFRYAEFKAAHPEIYDACVESEVKEVLNKTRLQQEHGHLLEPFRSRALLVK